MVELAAAHRQPNKAPYADVLQNVGRPSLSGVSDMPVVDLADPNQGNDGNLTDAPPPKGEIVAPDPVDKSSEASQASDTSTSVEGEADSGPTKTAGEDKTSPQDRAVITRFKNQAKAADARAEKLAQQVEQALAAIAKLTEKPAAEDPRPTREAFETPEAYDEAFEAYVARQTETRVKAEAQVEQTRQEQVRRSEEVRSTYKNRADAFAETHPDYPDLVDADDAGFSLAMAKVVMTTEDGPAVAYHLAKHPEMLERIAKLDETSTAVEMGKIAAKLATPPAPKPAPIKPLAGRSTPAERTPDEMSMDEYARHRAAKAKAN